MGGNLDQIQVMLPGDSQSFTDGHYPQLLTFCTDDPNFFGPDTLVNTLRSGADLVTSSNRWWSADTDHPRPQSQPSTRARSYSFAALACENPFHQ
jgi:hypothetical protein